MTTNISSRKQTSFYLHSNKNRCLYPPTKYPLTHLLDEQSIEYHLSKQPAHVKHFKYAFFLTLLFIFIASLFFNAHILFYNSFFGPFHLNIEEFIQHVKNYENGQSWFKRIEYIQVELGENNIQNPTNPYDAIKRYSNPRTREDYIATYKKVKRPQIYVKLPTLSQPYIHTHFPFHFASYSIRSLQCIVKNLQSGSETTYKGWVEKSEYVKYINEEYAKNATSFNILVLRKCGILVGYLYRPIYEKAFIPTREHIFYSNDIAFDATRQYCSFYSLLICSLIFIVLCLKGLFHLFLYLWNIIRYKLLSKYGIILFPLNLSSNVMDELWLLNIDDSPHKQLLQLDELIQQSQHKFNNQLFIIENYSEELCVVLLKAKLYDKSNVENELSPFVLCPVTDIEKMTHLEGICYGYDSSWIPWPPTMTDEQHYSEWLHEELMEISDDYKTTYEYRLQNEQINECQPSSNGLNPHSPSNNLNNVRARHQRRVPERRRRSQKELKQFIREEENFQYFERERQSIFERLYEQRNPASAQYIANFRMQAKENRNLINAAMEQQQIRCTICLDYLKLDDAYEKWPCPSDIPHIFHYQCMLNTLRKHKTCPICRHSI